jgi:hypothetical protein
MRLILRYAIILYELVRLAIDCVMHRVYRFIRQPVCDAILISRYMRHRVSFERGQKLSYVAHEDFQIIILDAVRTVDLVYKEFGIEKDFEPLAAQLYGLLQSDDERSVLRYVVRTDLQITPFGGQDFSFIIQENGTRPAPPRIAAASAVGVKAA